MSGMFASFINYSFLTLGITLTSAIFIPAEAFVANGGFETGAFDSWQTIGDTSIETDEFGISPTQGTFQALLSNDNSASGGSVRQTDLEEFLNLATGVLDNLGNGNAIEGSAIKQTFSANAGDVLLFDWNFLTNEVTSSRFNDFAFFSITPFTFELADTNSAFTFFDLFTQTGYQTQSLGISQDGIYTLSFGVLDVGNPAVKSQLLIDNIRIASADAQPVPEPLTILGAGVALGFGTFFKRKLSEK